MSNQEFLQVTKQALFAKIGIGDNEEENIKMLHKIIAKDFATKIGCNK